MRGTKKDIQQLFFQVAVIDEVLLNMKTHWTNSEPSCWLYLPVYETTKWPGVIQLEQPAPDTCEESPTRDFLCFYIKLMNKICA